MQFVKKLLIPSPRRVLTNLALVFFPAVVHADAPPHVVSCLKSAASYQGLPYELLLAIAKVESSFNSKAINKNKNETHDIGLMQINTVWLPEIKKYGVTVDALWNPCTNASVGAWILAQNVKRFGFTVEALGSYNAGPGGHHEIKIRYANKVLAHYREYLSNP